MAPSAGRRARGRPRARRRLGPPAVRRPLRRHGGRVADVRPSGSRRAGPRRAGQRCAGRRCRPLARRPARRRGVGDRARRRRLDVPVDERAGHGAGAGRRRRGGAAPGRAGAGGRVRQEGRAVVGRRGPHRGRRTRRPLGRGAGRRPRDRRRQQRRVGADRGRATAPTAATSSPTTGSTTSPPRSSPGAGAACCCGPTTCEDVGLFDERFFLYYEDTDLSWRGRGRGWRYRYVPEARVRHIHAASTRRGVARVPALRRAQPPADAHQERAAGAGRARGLALRADDVELRSAGTSSPP